MSRNRLSQKRRTCWGTSRSSATSLMVRNASGAFSKIALLRLRVALFLLVVGIRVDALLEDGGRLEHHDPARRDRDLLAGLGIASDPLAFLAHHEGAEGRQLHVLAALDAVGNFLEHEVDKRSLFRALQPHPLV